MGFKQIFNNIGKTDVEAVERKLRRIAQGKSPVVKRRKKSRCYCVSRKQEMKNRKEWNERYED